MQFDISELKDKLINELDKMNNQYYCDQDEIIDRLVELLESMRLIDKDNVQILIEGACRKNDIKLLRQCLTYISTHQTEFDINKDEKLLAHICAKNGNLQMLQILRNHGSSMEGVLSMAGLYSHINIVKYLVEKCGCDPYYLKGTSSYNNWGRPHSPPSLMIIVRSSGGDPQPLLVSDLSFQWGCGG